jgi:formylglycine-generating enzyme required for sulfatase activity
MSRIHLPRWRIIVPLFALAGVSSGLFCFADEDAAKGRRYALLVGVKNYNKDQLRGLKYTENDAADLAAVLRDAGYKRVVLMTQSNAAAEGDNDLLPTGDTVRRQLAALLEDRKPGDTVLIAFSGHGVQFKDEKDCYFCPMDAELADRDTLVSLADIYKRLEKCDANLKVLLVDASRNDPLSALNKGAQREQLESATRPQAERPPGGVAALFTCSEGQQSYESPRLKHGVFFHFVIEGLKGKAANKKGEVTFDSLASYVKDEVPDQVKDDVGETAKQRPHSVGDLPGSAALTSTALAKEYVNSLKMKLVRIPAGRFTMGSPNDEDGREDDEGPRHDVEITQAFYMGAYPVTKGQFAAFAKDTGYKTEGEMDGKGRNGYDAAKKRFVGPDPKYTWRETGWAQTDDHPVVNVTWTDAREFCRWLSKKEGKTYELPTEAEWEYACRAGTTTRFWCGDKDESLKGNANIADASLQAKLDADAYKVTFQSWGDDGFAFTSPVGSFKPNPWGLYDMHGNVGQWCADRNGPYQQSPIKDPNREDYNKDPQKGERRVVRGGAWSSLPSYCRSACRGAPGYGCETGFRVVLRPPARNP